MAKQPVIWIISNDDWPRTLLRAELIERGYDAVGFMGTAEALAQRQERAPDLVIVDLADADRGDARSLFELQVPVIGYGGTVTAEQKWIRKLPWTAVMPRPVSLGEIADCAATVLKNY